jgi:hypothetical protein
MELVMWLFLVLSIQLQQQIYRFKLLMTIKGCPSAVSNEIMVTPKQFQHLRQHK